MASCNRRGSTGLCQFYQIASFPFLWLDMQLRLCLWQNHCGLPGLIVCFWTVSYFVLCYYLSSLRISHRCLWKKNCGHAEFMTWCVFVLLQSQSGVLSHYLRFWSGMINPLLFYVAIEAQGRFSCGDGQETGRLFSEVYPVVARKQWGRPSSRPPTNHGTGKKHPFNTEAG